MSQKIKVAVVGLGNRGNDIYAHYQLVAPEEMEVVAVGDPIASKREYAQQVYGVKKEYCFETAEQLLEQPKLADAMIIATQDQQHVKQAVAAIKKGYHVLCEKPISPSLEDCLLLQKTAHAYGKIVAVGHVLRYTPFYSKVKELIQSGRIGEVVTIQAMEPVIYWHQAHSYVRGNWGNSKNSSQMLLAKSCHDLDIFAWLLEKKCKRISSYGDLYLFTPDKAPIGAAQRCLLGCKAKEGCPYDAEKIYITNKETGIREVIAQGKTGNKAWPVCILSPDDLSEETIYKQLQEGPYGRCVYACDNDVVDHQVVNMEFEDRVTVNFTMTAFTAVSGRTIRVCGTKGEIIGNLSESLVTIAEFGKEKEHINTAYGDMSGHAGGDNRLIHDFLKSIKEEMSEEQLRTGIDVSIQSHAMAAAAEYSRLHDGESILMEAFLDKYKPETQSAQ